MKLPLEPGLEVASFSLRYAAGWVDWRGVFWDGRVTDRDGKTIDGECVEVSGLLEGPDGGEKGGA